MRILLICPAKAGSRLGNRVTALRWKRLLTSLGHRATIATSLGRRRCDVVIALHARKGAPAVFEAFAREERPRVVVALTGTDLYRDVARSADARKALALADRLMVLHALGAEALPRAVRHKARVVPQSAIASIRRSAPSKTTFDVAVLGHLRSEKDPFRAALAARSLPAHSRIRVLHAGRALDDSMRRRAEAEMRRNPRYQWFPSLTPARARALLARSQLMVLSSRIEGGANVLSEAIADDVPIVASRIPSSVGVLGRAFPGFFAVGDTRALARLLMRGEDDVRFLRALKSAGRARRKLVSLEREQTALRTLLAELCG